MNRAVDISVVIPVYNAEATLSSTVGSILVQTGLSYEIILVDDGSTDASGLLCDGLAAEHPAIRVIHTPNRGVSSARNTGMREADGEYVMFMDADDLLKKDALKSLYMRDMDFITGGFEKVTPSGTLAYVPDASMLYEGVECMCGFLDMMIKEDQCYLLNSPCFKLFRSSLIKEKNISFVEGLSYAEDKIFVLSFLYHAQKVRSVSQVVYSYMIREESLSSDLVSDRHLTQVFRLLSVYAPLLSKLIPKFGGSMRMRSMYHNDLVSRYVCRILTAFSIRPSALATEENIRSLYAYMDEDTRLGMFSIRLGQIPNILLYRLGSARFSAGVYRMTSSICSIFRNE